MIEDVIGDAVEAGIANPEVAERLGVGLLVVGGVLWLVVWRLARPRRRRPALVASSPRRCPAQPFVPRLEDPPTRVIQRMADRTEAFPNPWGAGVRRG